MRKNFGIYHGWRIVGMLITFVFTFQVTAVFAQQRAVIASVVDEQTGNPLVGATVRWIDGKGYRAGSESARVVTTDANGEFSIIVPEGAMIEISYLGYGLQRVQLATGKVYALKEIAQQLGDVVVTATESKSLTSASNISKHAMEHLQPSSFTDVLELLPGGMARDPALSTPNTINLREVPVSSSDYTTSSLGTAFVIDGARMSTNANLQYLSGSTDAQGNSRTFVNEGVDMRSISTDDIENIEVVRGIPSVEYGDLTSGLVKISRRRGGHNLSARFKADMDTKLFYVAKGFEWKTRKLTFNVSADWLSNHADPRNLLETYSRLTISARISKQWHTPHFSTELAVNTDYSGSFDNDKVDPELNYGGVDKYKSSYNHFSTDLTLKMHNMRAGTFFRSMTANISLSTEQSRTERTRLVQLDRETPAATSTTTGEADAVLISPYTYTGTQTVDGLPLNIYAKLNADFALPKHSTFSFKLKTGADWQMDKNYGDGQIFDPLHPLYPGLNTRPRTFRSIPASHQAGLYTEATIGLPLGHFRFDTQAGVRTTTLLNLPSDYLLHGKIYVDPRLNAGLTLPIFTLASHDFIIRIAGGVGQHTKMPTLDQLYPNKTYLDIVELNYYHTVKDYRRIYLQTYVIDPTNRNLKAARNLKWEVSIDANWWGNRLTLTYFRENMTSGFRTESIYAPYSYRKFDTSSIDANTLTSQPNIAVLAYERLNDLRSYSTTTNGSQTKKEGVELTISTLRVPVINTRLTVTGAWFKSQYRNSLNVMQRPNTVINGSQINAVGIYRDDDGYIREMYNTNFTFDTDIPRLKLGLSLSMQCVWLTASQTMFKDNAPVQYMDSEGVIHNFTVADAEDAVLQFLVRTYNNSLYVRNTVPFSMNVNLKATKKLLDDRLMVALFVNKLWDAHPDYVRNNFKIRRYVTPYFGLELNVKI